MLLPFPPDVSLPNPNLSHTRHDAGSQVDRVRELQERRSRFNAPHADNDVIIEEMLNQRKSVHPFASLCRSGG